MIKCKDCKHWHYSYGKDECFEIGECRFVDVVPKETDETQGCTDGERRDGLTECCETCGYYEEASHKDIVEDNFWNCCQKEYWDINGSVDINKMKCDEWEAK